MNLRDCLDKILAAPYDAEAKAAWLRYGKRLLALLARELELPKDSYDIRTNPGGPAVPGDVVLHHERLYVHLGSICGGYEIGYARTCRGRRDYVGGSNQWIDAQWDLDRLVQLCRKLLE